MSTRPFCTAFVLLGAAAAPTSRPQSSLRANAISNSALSENFESPQDGTYHDWILRPRQTQCTADACRTHAHTGSYAIKHTVPSNQPSAPPHYVSMYKQTSATLTKGANYSVTAWLWTRSPAGLMVCDGVSGDSIVRIRARASSFGQWQRLQVPAYTVDATRIVRVHLEQYASGNAVYWDDVSVSRV